MTRRIPLGNSRTPKGVVASVVVTGLGIGLASGIGLTFTGTNGSDTVLLSFVTSKRTGDKLIDGSRHIPA